MYTNSQTFPYWLFM